MPRFPASTIRAASVILSAWACSLSAAADDELQRDTNAIERLTPAEAHRLVADFDGVPVHLRRKHRGLFGDLPLQALKTLDKETATELSAYDRGWLLLDGLTSLSHDVARQLGTTRFGVSLDGLTDLSAAAATALVASGQDSWGRLSVGGLRTISPDVARTLSGSRVWNRRLTALTTLSPDAARALAVAAGPEPACDNMILGGLSTIDAVSAGNLADYTGSSLTLDVKTLSVAAAEALTRFAGDRLTVAVMEELDTAAAAALAAFDGTSLSIVVGSELTVDAATALVAFGGDVLAIESRVGLSADAAHVLATFEGPRLDLGETPLTVEACRELVGFSGVTLATAPTALAPAVADCLAVMPAWSIDARRLRSLEPGAAHVLASRSTEELVLRDLAALSAAAAAELATFKGRVLALDGLTAIDADTARAVATFRGESLQLNGLSALDSDSAAGLASFRGRLHLDSLVGLTAEAAVAIAKHEGRNLDLPSLTVIDGAVARALAGFKGRSLAVTGIAAPDITTVAALATFRGDVLRLWLKELDVETARMLVTFRGETLNLRVGTLSAAAATALGEGRRERLQIRLHGPRTLDAETATVLAGSPWWEGHLGDLKALPAEVAGALAAFNGQSLSLGDLKTLSTDTARALASCQCRMIILRGLTTIDADAAAALAGFAGTLSLPRADEEAGLAGIADAELVEMHAARLGGGRRANRDGGLAERIHLAPLTPDTARRLVALSRDGQATIVRVAALDGPDAGEIATILAAAKGSLWLPRLAKLSPAAARPLATAPAWTGGLPRLTELSPVTAAHLAAHAGPALGLDGVTAIDAATAAALAAFAGGAAKPDLYLGVTTLDADTARALAAFGGTLHLDRLPRLSVAAARELARFRGPSFSLAGLTRLDADTAAVLVRTAAWQASLPSLETLDAATARALADLDRELKLSGGTSLKPEAARGLADFKGPMLTIDFSGRGRRLTVEHATALAEFRGRHLTISGLRRLPADVARALAEFRGHDLSLIGPPWRRVAAARALAGFTGDTLTLLDGTLIPRPFERLILLPTNATLAALASFRGRHLRLEPGVYEKIGGRVPLTVVVARLVAIQPPSADGELGTSPLGAITAIDGPDAVAIARILATTKGPLVMPNLTRISPRTLSTLLEKEDVEIPLTETLELIPEPDGSPADDVVIPQKFLDRQKQ